MIQATVQCDKCKSTAQIVGGFQQYNNGIIGFPIPENWFHAGELTLCNVCIQKSVKKEVEGIENV